MSADEGQLVQVFTNMIINAQQAMPQGGAIRDSRREHRRAGRTRASTHGVVDAGRYVEDHHHRRGHRHSGREPRQDLRSVFHDEAEGQRARSRDVVLDHQESRRLCRGGVEVRAGHDAAREPSGRRRAAAPRSSRPRVFAPQHGRRSGRILVMDDEASTPHAGGQHAHVSRARRRRRRQRQDSGRAVHARAEER